MGKRVSFDARLAEKYFESKRLFISVFFYLGEEFWSLGLGSQLFTLGNDVLHLLKTTTFIISHWQ